MNERCKTFRINHKHQVRVDMLHSNLPSILKKVAPREAISNSPILRGGPLHRPIKASSNNIGVSSRMAAGCRVR